MVPEALAVLSMIAGAPVQVPDVWPYGKFRGYYENGTVYLKPGVAAKLMNSIAGKNPPGGWTAFAWNILAHERAHHLGYTHDNLKGPDKMRATDQYALTHMKLLMKKAGIPKDVRQRYYKQSRDNGWLA